MKKALFVLFAVLLASFLATCDLLELPPEEVPPGSTEDGMVRLTIDVGGVGTSRALIDTYAQSDADYYEVVFKFGSKLYQKAFENGDSVGDRTIIIPIADYAASENDAIMFAGIKTGKILLGVGEILAVDGNTSTKKITGTTSSVTFTLSALENNVNDIPANSTFQIMSPNSYKTSEAGTIPTVNDPGPPSVNYPVFLIPPAGYNDPSEDIVAEYSVDIPTRGDAVILQDDWTATDITTTVTSLPGTAVTGTVSCTRVTPATGSAGTALVNDPNTSTFATFTFAIDVSACTADGLCAIAIDVPVCALSSTASFATGSRVVWHIMGGTDSTTPDDGTGKGAPVLLSVGP
jgi:hypothetical protein